MGYNDSNAYDLSLFEQRESYVRAARAEAGASRAGRASGKQAGKKNKVISAEQMAEARRLFSDLNDTEIYRLYKKVSN